MGAQAMSARQYLTDIYLHWLNDFLSVAIFAEYHGITDAQAADLIALARDIFNTDHPEA
jgi:hypothetical protein